MTTWHSQDDPRIAWLLKVFNIDFFHKLPRLASVATILNFIPDASHDRAPKDHFAANPTVADDLRISGVILAIFGA